MRKEHIYTRFLLLSLLLSCVGCMTMADYKVSSQARIIITDHFIETYVPANDLERVRLVDQCINIYVKFMNVPNRLSKYDILLYNQNGDLVHTRNKQFTTKSGVYMVRTEHRFIKEADKSGKWKVTAILNGVQLAEREIIVE